MKMSRMNLSTGRWLLGLASSILLVVLGITPEALAQKAHTAAAAAEGCAVGTMLDDEKHECVPIVDKRQEFKAETKRFLIESKPPNLAHQRLAHYGTQYPPRAGRKAPVPGGIGAGVQYKPGQLANGDYTMLATYMTAYDSIGCLSNYVYTTASNRTYIGVEVLGYYPPGCGGGTLALYDWSCSVVSPCDGEITQPDWVGFVPFDSCYLTFIDDGGGHSHNFVRYRNLTELDGPNYWGNYIYLYNYCSSSWDLVWYHGYTVGYVNCSTEGGGYLCGWFGPIVETFDDNRPYIKEIGFLDSKLRIGSSLYTLTSTNTDWTQPNPAWTLFHLAANHTWGLGNTTGN